VRTDRRFDVSHLKYDKRLLEMHYKDKSLSPEDYKKHLESLPDQSENAGKIKLFEVEEKVAPTIDPADPLATNLSVDGDGSGVLNVGGFGNNSGSGDQNGGGNPFGGAF